MSNFSVKDIRGVIPAMVTPFDENEALDLARTRALTAKLIEDGAQGLYLTGSTGEGFLCTSDERKAFVETVLDEAAGRIPVIVHVGAISTLASEDLARHAAQGGRGRDFLRSADLLEIQRRPDCRVLLRSRAGGGYPDDRLQRDPCGTGQLRNAAASGPH